MHYFDIIAADIQTYRQNILFSLDKDDPTVTVALVEICLVIIPEVFRKNVKLTDQPKQDGILTEEYRRLQKAWVLENLYKVEECYSQYLKGRNDIFTVLQGAASSYRQSILFNLQREKNPVTARGLVKIMNMLLPEGQRAKLPELVEGKGIESLSWKKEADLRKWVLDSLKAIESALGLFVFRMMNQSQH